MNIKIFFTFLSIVALTSAKTQFYDTFSGTPISDDELKRYYKLNSTFWCAIEIEECDPNEGRRLDGSCNNLEHPTRGATHTPFLRVLPATYGKGYEPRPSKSGKNLALARVVRNQLLSVGRVPSVRFTQMAIYFILFMATDVAALHDTINYILWTPYCCTPRGITDHMCTPNYVPQDDPVHRFSGIRCLNMTRPISFQSSQCLPNNTTPERINSATPLLDISLIYGSIRNASLRARLYEGGLLRYEEENGKLWPPSSKGPVNLCLLNDNVREKRCHATPDDGTNSLLGMSLSTIWFWRNHNRIATTLSELNPCWDDDKLFDTARNINIATAIQIYLYELLPVLIGRENLLRDGVLSISGRHRDLYNPNVLPQVSLEYPFALRWFHNMQEGRVKMYDAQGHYLKQTPMVNLTLKTGYLAIDDNLDGITQGAFRQPCAKSDFVVDPDIAEVVLGPHQRASDVFTNDLAKNRYFGLAPYIDYLKLCFHRTVTNFDQLREFIDEEQIEGLKDVYEHVEDIDLMAGLWVERWIKGGFIPSTLYCLMKNQLIRSMISDRFFYESSSRPDAFTVQQLKEIRKASIARVLCDVGDSVTNIQRQAFIRPGPGNRLVSCKQIERIDLNAWKDDNCEKCSQ